MTTNSWLSLSFFVEIHKSNNLRKHKGMYFSFVLSVCTERSKLDAHPVCYAPVYTFPHMQVEFLKCTQRIVLEHV